MAGELADHGDGGSLIAMILIIPLFVEFNMMIPLLVEFNMMIMLLVEYDMMI